VNDVVILGAGGFARELYWVFLEANEQKRQWNVLGFLDDKPELNGQLICDVPVLGTIEWLGRNRGKSTQVISSAGSPRARQALAERATALGFRFATIVHPSARISRWVDLGPGTVITAGCVLTTQVKIGAHTVINLNSTVGHDCVIGAYTNINPGCQISGAVRFGDGVYFGTGAVIIQNKSVGEWSVIGAGAVVTSDIPAYVTAVGVPCRVIREQQIERAVSLKG